MKKLWNMKVKVIPIVNGVFGTISKGMIKRLDDLEIRGRIETIQTTSLLKSVRILSKPFDLLSLKLQWETIGQCWCEKFSKEKQ